MSNTEPVISVIIPVFLEENAIGRVVENTRKVLGNLNDAFEVIVVNDGSDDASAEKARRAGARVVSHPYNMGNGASIKTGIRHARGQIMVMMDGDGQHDPADIPRLLEKIGPYDMAVGARSKNSQTRVYRDLANWGYNSLASYVCSYPIEDLTSGFRAVKASIARTFVSLLPNTFSYPTTLTISVLRSGFSIAYVPIDTSYRVGKSKIRLLRDGTRFLLIIMKIATLFSPMKIFLPVTGFLFFGALTYGLFKMLFIDGRYGQTAGLVMVMAVLVFMVGLVSEQVAQLRYDRVEAALVTDADVETDESSSEDVNAAEQS
jgi:glycosyltransferase involved in cell wall biosynthesis